MLTYARALSPIVFDQLTTLKSGQTYQGDHTSQDYQTSVIEWLDSLTYTPKYTNQYPKHKDQDQLTNEQERIVAYGTDDNGNEDQSEHTFEPKYFINGNDILRKNDSRTQLQATAIGEANLKINITKISANTPPHNFKRTDVFGGSG
ncbi:MAG: hypothetical protein EZS28_053115 [Streblomastix strix]|uniref:Uncharacterized protein n=1 Tax=Streblomastix strix TaxID=222440 RepID=A0A5J4RJW4_9EUKA|nr:MAG: hypothetical protein EZS28_053115 [Streblomastix strix]